MLDVVTMKEIEKIFEVTDAMGISREAVVIPLSPGKGRVRRLPSGKLEITVDEEVPIEAWVKGLPDMIRSVPGSLSPPAGGSEVREPNAP